MRTMIVLAAAALIGAASPSVAADVPDQMRGKPTVTDGDSLRFGDVRVRFHGIDAPESTQKCRDAGGAVYRCGAQAAVAMTALVHGREIVCRKTDVDRYRRMVARCHTVDGGLDLGAAMVAMGWALAYRKYSQDHVAIEDVARKDGAGVWAGEFVPPWDWRRGKRLKP